MATSGTFTGSRGGNSYGPWLTLAWDRQDVDIARNRSLIRLTLRLHADRPISFSSSKTGVLDGTSFTYTGGFSGGSKVIKTKDVWVNHNSDGSRKEAFSASFNIAVSWGGSTLSSISVSGTADITDIPRTSSFSISGNTLGSAITVSISRASTSFTHEVIYDLPDGSRRSSWDGIGTSHTFTPSLADAQYIANSTSGTAKIVVKTYSGSTYIGMAHKTFTMNVPASVKPNASGLSVSISGSGRDKTIGQYVQSISKLYASFSTSAMYGASITTSHISIKRSDGKNPQTIRGTSGTSPNVLELSGTYTIEGYVRDSRGRTDTVSTTITVQAYSPPSISKFTASRATLSTTVNAALTAKWSNLGTSNPATVTVVGVSSAKVTQSLYTLANNTAGSLSTTRTFTGQSDASSFTYTMKVTDSFGKTATSVARVGTSFIELTISKGKGIGVGKVHERGSLDVNGDAHFRGFVDIAGVGQGGKDDEGALRITGSGKAAKIQYGSTLGMADHAYFEWSKNGVREAYLGIPSDTNGNFHITNYKNGADGMFALGDHKLYAIDGTATYDGVPVFTSDGGTLGNDLLWEGGIYLNATQTVTPTKPIQDCVNGWLLCWSEYVNGNPANSGWQYTFIPKRFATMTSGGMWVALNGNGATPLVKYVYATTTQISGHSRNSTSPQNQTVLRFVYSY